MKLQIHLDIQRMESERSRFNYLNIKTKYLKIKKSEMLSSVPEKNPRLISDPV